VDSHPNDVVAIMYHMSWPGYDPFYYYNTSHNDQRRGAYAVNWVPWVEVDGEGDVGAGGMASHYGNRIATPTDVGVDISGTYDAGSGNVDVTVTATTTSELPSGNVQYRIYVALTETNIYYAGSNGVNWHHQTMRRMFPTGNGNVVSFTGSLPQSASVSFQFTLDPILAPENCRIVAWMQDAVGKEVYNSNWAFLADLGDQTGVSEAPASYALERNFPNPFNPKTVIPLRVDRGENLRVEVLSTDGRLVKTLHDGWLDAGSHEFNWDGRDGEGRSLASGVYLARVTGSQGGRSQRLVLMK